ncbi:MAG: hypothetical protein ACTSXJ_10740 [Candidatus Baldrarchaeia archaeon]
MHDYKYDENADICGDSTRDATVADTHFETFFLKHLPEKFGDELKAALRKFIPGN